MTLIILYPMPPYREVSFRRRCSLAFLISLTSTVGRISISPHVSSLGCTPQTQPSHRSQRSSTVPIDRADLAPESPPLRSVRYRIESPNLQPTHAQAH